jgi:hypothetical protein
VHPRTPLTPALPPRRGAAPQSDPVRFFRGGLNDNASSSASYVLLSISTFVTWVFAKSVYNAATLGAKYGIVGGVAYASWWAGSGPAAAGRRAPRPPRPAASLVASGSRDYGTAAALTIWSHLLIIFHGPSADPEAPGPSHLLQGPSLSQSTRGRGAAPPRRPAAPQVPWEPWFRAPGSNPGRALAHPPPHRPAPHGAPRPLPHLPPSTLPQRYVSFGSVALVAYFMRTRMGYRSLPEAIHARYGDLAAAAFALAVVYRRAGPWGGAPVRQGAAMPPPLRTWA